MSRILRCVVAFLLFAGGAGAESQNFRQHVELLTEGTITDASGRTWNVRFVPGTRRINDVLVDGWTGAGESMLELVGADLWLDDIPEAVVDGGEFSRDVIVEHFAEGLADDVRLAQRRNAELRPGDFGRSFIIPWNWTKAATMMTFRTLWLPVGTTLGVTYSVAAPPVMVAWRPIEATLQVGFTGVLAPTLGHIWNGTTWTATFLNDVPERESRWVSRTLRRVPFEMDATGLELFVRGTAAEHVLETDSTDTHDAVREIDAEIRALRAKKDELVAEMGRSHPEARSARAEKQKLHKEARYGGPLEWTPEAEAALEDAALDAMIAEELDVLGVDADEQTVDAIRERVARELRALSRPR